MANICFDCKNAVPDNNGHGCPWSRKFEPVPGWTAEPTMLRPQGGYGSVRTFNVTACPLFTPDDPAEKRPDGAPVPVKVRCIETGAVFNSMNAAARAVGHYSGAGINTALKDGRSFAYGYHWEVVEDD